jgi:hypothetical protein
MHQPDNPELLSQSLITQSQILSAAASIQCNGEITKRDEPVRQLIARSAELVRGAASLGKDKNAVALGILARAILENLIVLLWVQVSELNAKELSETGVVELSRVARINLESGNAKIRNRENGQDVTEEFLAAGRFKNLPKRKSVASQAEEAGVEDLYNIFYRFLSLEMHGHETSSSQENGANELPVIHMHGIGALSKAVGHAGVRWLLHRERTDNETLREILGLAA